ncbi:MAG: site-2 protease family protein [Polyangiaceae bacterium]
MMRFSIGNIPVTVHAPFFFMALLLGAQGSFNVPRALAWIVVVFLSVLAHELGHAFSGIAFGLTPRIDLHGMGGTTSWAHKNVGTVKRILISVAGPLVGIVIGGGLYLAAPFVVPSGLPPLAREILGTIIYVNLVWGVLNLLPMLPLDGGNALAAALAHFKGAAGMRIAHYVSVVVAVTIGLYVIATDPSDWWALLLLGLFAFQNVRALLPQSNDGGGPPRAPQQW